MDLAASIIIPIWNSEKYIKETLYSVLNNNSNKNNEIIIIDDGSTDNSEIIIKDVLYKISNINYIKTNNLGPSRTRNIGIKHAKNNIICFLDHDDLWPSNRIKSHINLLIENPYIDVIVGKTQYFSDNNKNLNNYNFLDDSNSIYHVHLGASTFRKEVFDKIGLFDESMTYSEDHDLFLRIRENNLNLYFDDKIALKYRVHDTNMSKNKSLKELGVFDVLYKSIKRRRELNNNIYLQKFGKE